MSSTGSRTNPLFPLTPWGLTLLAAASAVLILGAARMELAALVWGSSFLLLALYALVGNHLSRGALARHLRRSLEAVDFRLPSEGLFPGSEAAAEIASELPRTALPGFQVWLVAVLGWQARPPLRLSALLESGRQRRVLAFRAPSRGLYSGEAVLLVVRDVLGFTRSELAVPLAEQLRVFPSVRAEELRVVPGAGGLDAPRRSRRRLSDELLEVRKYYPGDDMRRIHWKLFAHVQQLFLRAGEESPPPESRFLALLDLSLSPLLPPAARADTLDGMLEACASAVTALMARGMQVQVAVTDRSSLLSVTLEKAERLLELCSELWWNERFEVELPRTGHREVLLYSLPGSGRQGQLLRTCAARNWNVHVFLKQPPEFPRRSQSLLRRLVFSRPNVPAEPPDEELRKAYLRVLAETETRLARARNVHVARI